MSNKKYLEIKIEIEGYGFTIVEKNCKRPWSAVLVINLYQAQV